MLKKIVTLAMMLCGFVSAFAQGNPMETPLPLDPAVKHGVLPNGLSYYIQHNEEPKNRANFYIAQKVGSTLETPEQLGLAHFLEHMAFNGTKNYPGKAMLEYLQSKGIRFGADINAYTGFDETVYNVNNVPCNDVALMDSVLLVLHDWSCDILLETEEIESERGVIHEEWRTRDNAMLRMYNAMLPAIYEEYQYHQMPIGSMDVVMNFDPQVLREYYHTWYRPDQQGIVIVGDFDAAEMEQKVIKLFSEIPMPENAKERTYPAVSDNKEPIYFSFQDPETTRTQAWVSFKYEKLPFELRNTMIGLINDELMEYVISSMINNRLNEYSQKPECRYAYAGVSFGDFWISKTKGAFNLTVVAKDDIEPALSEAMAIVTRACQTGFTDSELERTESNLLSMLEKAYNERNKTNSDAIAQGLIRHFIDNTVDLGAEQEYELFKSFLPQLNVQMFNEAASQLLTRENQVIVYMQPQTADSVLPEKAELVGIVENSLGETYEAYVDEVITDPLISKYAKAGKIKSETTNAELGTTTFTLSNGATVIVKPTDFSADEVMLEGIANGGKRLFSESQAADVLMLEDAVESSRLGNFTRATLRKYLAGKNAGVGYSLNNFTTVVQGVSGVKDMETMFDLVYATFTSLSADDEAYAATCEQARAILKNNDKNPGKIFQLNLSKTMYGDNPLMLDPTVETVDQASYPTMLDMARQTMANAADFTFTIVGNVDLDALRPLLCKYIASLPANKKAARPAIVTPIEIVRGNVENDFQQPMQNPITQIVDCYSGTNLPYCIENQVKMSVFGQILSMIFTETLREEMGGAYSPYAYGSMNPYMNLWQLIYAIDTNADIKQAMIDRAHNETLKLINEGAPAEKFNKVKQATLAQYENAIRTNSYWENNLSLYGRGWNNITGHKAAIENLTIESLNEFMKSLWSGEDRIQVIMTGVPEQK